MTDERILEIRDDLSHDFEDAEMLLDMGYDVEDVVSHERKVVSELVTELPERLRHKTPEVIASELTALGRLPVTEECHLPIEEECLEPLTQAFGSAADVEYLGVAMGGARTWNRALKSKVA